VNYHKKNIHLDCIQTNPIGIWQANKQVYYFFESKYTFYLTRNEVKVLEGQKELHKFTFKNDFLKNNLSYCIQNCLELLKIDRALMFGFISYDYARHIEDIKNFKYTEEFPDYYFMIPNLYAKKDLETDKVQIFDLEDRSDYSFLEKQKREQKEKSGINLDYKTTQFKLKKDQKNFCKITEQAKEYIREGDIFQAVLSNEIEFKNKTPALNLHNTLIDRNPSAYHFLINFLDKHLVGASPETMLEYNSADRKLTMRLVAGTYPKESNDFKSDPNSLLKDEKELAEHMMLVDHCRNDIGKHAKISSVEVTELLKLVSLNDIYHLVSMVNAELKENKNCFDALEACFPIATLTGTPKIRAMEIISELEDSPRKLFGGAVGIIETSKDLKEQKLDLAVIIRSALLTNETSYINAGAGIVSDSDANREFHECLWKAKALREILLDEKRKQEDSE